MNIYITQDMIDNVRTYLTNIEEPNSDAEWDAFEKKDFRKTALPVEYIDKSPFIDKDECTKLLQYLDIVMEPEATIGAVYDTLSELEEDIIQYMEYLKNKEECCGLDDEEMHELLDEGVTKRC